MHARLVTAALLAALAPAQGFYVPDPAANLGTCNAIPFSGGGLFSNQKYQMMLAPTDLGGVPGLITGLGFATCGSGVHDFASIDVVMDHAATTTLSSTFAQNLSPNAVTVLHAINYSWHSQIDTWVEVGLQNFFSYDGTSNLVIDITVTGADYVGTGTGSCRRDVGPRLYATGWTTPPTSGTLTTGALKVEVSMLGARISKHGRGCVGTNGQPLRLVMGGLPQLGATISFGVASGPPSSLAFLTAGWDNGPPFPIELVALGMPTCYQYFAQWLSVGMLTDASGAATLNVLVPNSPGMLGALVYSQLACLDPGANPAGVTTSDYARILVGL